MVTLYPEKWPEGLEVISTVSASLAWFISALIPAWASGSCFWLRICKFRFPSLKKINQGEVCGSLNFLGKQLTYLSGDFLGFGWSGFQCEQWFAEYLIIWFAVSLLIGLSWWLNGRESACQFRRRGSDPRFGKILQRRKLLPTPVFLSGGSQGWRSLGG